MGQRVGAIRQNKTILQSFVNVGKTVIMCVSYTQVYLPNIIRVCAISYFEVFSYCALFWHSK